MTIRNALLRAFLWLVLGTTVLTGVLTFYEVSRALQAEIAGNLQSGAGAALQRIDTLLFAQLENLRVWRHLQLMQDIRVNDVDKRLSDFLSELRAGQGSVYDALFCTGRDGRVVASSDSAMIGRPAPDVAAWRPVPGEARAQVQIGPLDTASERVLLRSAIDDAFGSGRLGYLYAMLDWRAVLDLLDDAAAGPRGAVLVDARGRVIGASRNLAGGAVPARLDLSGWLDAARGPATRVRDGGVLGLASVLVGVAASSGYQHFPGLGWHVLMVEPTSQAYRPVWRLLWSMVSVLALVLLVAVWTSARLAGRIARPIVALTEFTRRFRSGDATRPGPGGGAAIAEVAELDRAYVDMIEALERSREQIVRAGKLAVVGEMAAIMAHEVRTPLGILRSSAQLLERQPDLDEHGRELTGYIVSESDRLNHLVTLLLECARPRPPVFKHHDLHDIAEQVLKLLEGRADKQGVTLVRAFDARDSLLDCDREQLTQVFLNLVLNALQFVSRGGRVGVRSADTDDGLLVQVIDDGPGIAAELRQRVFDPFFSRRDSGIGLGLTIVQQIVQVHHGDIRVIDSPWGGAGFELRFVRDVQEK